MIEVLAAAGVLAYIAGVFTIRYFVGEKAFRGKYCLRQGDRILLSRRMDAYLFDTIALCFLSLVVFILCFYGESALRDAGIWIAVICGLSGLMLLGARLLEKVCVFYDERGLWLSKPFRSLRFVPWNEIGGIRKRNAAAEIYLILDRNGRQLAWFPLTKKTQPFFDLARQNGIGARIPRGTEMVWDISGKKRNGTLGEWDAALARSAYAKNDVLSIAVFQGFMVVLFMDRRLNEDNIIAINQDGSVRWKISGIIKRPEPVPYAAMTAESGRTIRVLAVLGRRYDQVIYEIDVYEQKIVSQHSGDDV